MVANKSDVLSRAELGEEKEAIYKEIEKEIGAQILEMSTVTEKGVIEVKVLNTSVSNITFFYVNPTQISYNI